MSSLSHSSGRVQSPLASSQTLFESFCALTDDEYWGAAHFIASLMSPGAAAATPTLPKAQELQPHVVDIVYAVVKYMPRLDAILLSSDVLAVNPDLVPHIALVKLLLFQFMATHFASPTTFLLPPDPRKNKPNPIVRWAADLLTNHRTKLHAAYARVRIEHQAIGSTDAQRLASLVDWSALKAVEQAPVAFRVRVSPKAMLEAIQTCLPAWDPKEDVEWDRVQEDLIRVPGHLVGDLLASPLLESGSVVMQDACAGVPVQIVLDWLIPRVKQTLEPDEKGNVADSNEESVVVLDTRANHETRLRLYQDYAPTLATYVFPSPISRSFRATATAPNMPWSNSARLLERDSFLNLDPFDADSDVAPDIIIVEPENSQSAVLDEKHFLIQERTPKPVVNAGGPEGAEVTEILVKRQVDMLQHALKFTTAKYVLYTTRSTAAAENQNVVEACLESNKDWRLMTVGELDSGYHNTTDKSDSAVFHEDSNDKAKLVERQEAVTDDTTWIEIAPNPPNVTCGIFVAVLARHAVVDQALVDEQEDSVLDQEVEVATATPSAQEVEPEQIQEPRKIKRKMKRSQHRQKFSLRAWRVSMRGRDVSDLQVQGSAVELPLSREMKALSMESMKGDGRLTNGSQRRSSAFPIVVPWK